MIPHLNYELKAHFAVIYDQDRWGLLTLLMLHSNERDRCWPTMRGLAKMMGRSLPVVTRAKQWLIEHEAIEIVPYDKRVDQEKALPQRQHVYQLSGYISINGVKVQYIFNKPSKAVEDQYPETSKPDISQNEISNPETSTELIQSIIQNKELSISSKIQDIGISNEIPTAPLENESAIIIKPIILEATCEEKKSSAKRKEQPHIAIINAWFYTIPEFIRPPGKPAYPRNGRTARDMVVAGITPEQVIAFVVAKSDSYMEWAKSRDAPLYMPLEYVKNNVKGWLATQDEKVKANGHNATAPAHKPNYGF